MRGIIAQPRSRFHKVKCECGNEQIIFSHPAQPVKCIVCDKVLAIPRGGKGKIEAEIIDTY